MPLSGNPAVTFNLTILQKNETRPVWQFFFFLYSTLATMLQCKFGSCGLGVEVQSEESGEQPQIFVVLLLLFFCICGESIGKGSCFGVCISMCVFLCSCFAFNSLRFN